MASRKTIFAYEDLAVDSSSLDVQFHDVGSSATPGAGPSAQTSMPPEVRKSLLFLKLLSSR